MEACTTSKQSLRLRHYPSPESPCSFAMLIVYGDFRKVAFVLPLIVDDVNYLNLPDAHRRLPPSKAPCSRSTVLHDALMRLPLAFLRPTALVFSKGWCWRPF